MFEHCFWQALCVLHRNAHFGEMDPVFFGQEKVNPVCCRKFKPVQVLPVGICLLVCRGKKEKPHCGLKESAVVRFHCENHPPWVVYTFRSYTSPWTIGLDSNPCVLRESLLF